MPTSSNRYTPAPCAETEYQSGSRGRVLRNIQGITSKREMDRLEFEAFFRVQLEYSEHKITSATRFISALLRQMHKDWLGGLYEWAGQYRTVNLSKGGFSWPPAYLVASNMERFESGLLRECTPCRGVNISAVAEKVARVHGEFLLIHPFREGNGRMARWLGDLMSQQAGYPAPLWRLGNRSRAARQQQYLEAIRKAYAEDYRLLTDFVAGALEDAVSESRRPSAGRNPRAPSKREES